MLFLPCSLILWQSPTVYRINPIDYRHVCMLSQSLSRVWLFVTPWIAAHKAPLSMGILQAKILECVAMPSSRHYIGKKCTIIHQFSSVQFSRSVVSDFLRSHESQHARPLCPSPTPGVHWDSRPSSQWCHPAISSSVVPFSSCPQSLPASESFPMSQLFAWGGKVLEFQL